MADNVLLGASGVFSFLLIIPLIEAVAAIRLPACRDDVGGAPSVLVRSHCEEAVRAVERTMIRWRDP